jgi:endoglucanase
MNTQIRLFSFLAAAAAAVAIIPGAGTALASTPRARAAACSDLQYPATRDVSNPLALPRSPGSDPLRGAHFFINGPRHGLAAGGIEQLLGLSPTSFPESESWATFDAELHSGTIGQRLAAHPALAHKVMLLEKIASEPESIRFSQYSGGGGPGAIASQVQKFFCGFTTADPHSVPLITTYFLYNHGYCPTLAQILADKPVFERRINELASATGLHPAVFFLELDAIGSSSCMTGKRLAAWLSDVRFEVKALTALKHTVVYIEGGYSDSIGPAETARRLNNAGVQMARGFFTNDTHFAWTSDEINWGNQVSRLTHHSHFVINTADNGRGPRLNPHPVTQGIEDLCNPRGRGLGPAETANTGFTQVDAFVWTGTPGRGAGPCGQGYGPAGLFDLRWALQLSSNANGQIGPHYPSRPY